MQNLAMQMVETWFDWFFLRENITVIPTHTGKLLKGIEMHCNPSGKGIQKLDKEIAVFPGTQIKSLAW